MPLDVRIDPAPNAFPASVAALYPGQKPHCEVARIADSMLLVGAFRSSGEHWHYVGVGLRPHVSAELSFRVRAAGSKSPPTWPARVIARYAEHLVRGGSSAVPGHYLRFAEEDLDVPIASFALVPDPELAPTWLQIVALREAELARMGGDEWRELISSLSRRDPFFVY